jgi:ankyrin repeat protein
MASQASDVSPILQALYRGDTNEVVRLRAVAPALDVFEASALGDLARVRELTEGEPALVNAFSPDGFTPLHLAAFFAHPQTVAFLVERHAPLNGASQNAMQVTPLHSAVAGRNADAVRILVEAGARVNVRQRHGWTPLHGVAEHGDQELTTLLLDRGADPAARNDDGATAADLATAAGHTQLADRLRQK